MTAPGVFQLFVYGSLRSGFRSIAYEYISQHFTFVGHAKVKGDLFDMSDFPAGVPSSEEHFIAGELYRINNEDEFSWAIGQLDDYEGVNAEDKKTALYRREQVTVFIHDKTLDSWIYWFNGPTTGRPLLSSGDIMDYRPTK